MSEGSRPCVLCVGGLDPSGGAGLLVDAAAVRRAGAHPAGVAALITLQSQERFIGARPQAPEEVAAGMRIVLDSGAVEAVKTGALGGDARVVWAVARVLDEVPGLPLVVDPVLASTSGGRLMDAGGVGALLELLVPQAALVTPNLAEAAVLAGFPVDDIDGMVRAAREIGRLGARGVLVKGGHLAGNRVVDVLWSADKEVCFEEERLPGGDVRGTGCALAAAAAAFLALGEPLGSAVERARNIVRRAIERSASVGPGPRVLVFD